ncbi:hypothetical protein NFI96_018269 [Prochilodus magdalenae]|nr:hypothetical protein NFI96_018269 [Prochilodus magdalenae]
MALSDSPSMPVFVDESIQTCRAEEAKLTETIRQCRDLLRSMWALVSDSMDTDGSARGEDQCDDVPLKEQREIELLEQVLKRALRVRSSSAVARDSLSEIRSSCPSDAPMDTTVKDADRIKAQKSSPPSEARRRVRQRGAPLKGHAVSGPVHPKPFLPKRGPSPQSATRRNLLITKPAPAQVHKKVCQPATRSRDLHREPTVGGPQGEDKEFRTSSRVSPIKEQWVPSPLLPVWRAQRVKMNRLWNKVLTQHSKFVPERANFKDRLVCTFPMEWRSDQAAAGDAELNTLKQLRLDLTHCYHAEHQNRQHLLACVPGKDPGTGTDRRRRVYGSKSQMKRVWESTLMLEGLERMMAKAIRHADDLTNAWERKPGGPLFPLQRRGEWRDQTSCLPPILYYSTEAELEQLGTLRLRVDQLQLEIRMHQAMFDTHSRSLTPQRSSSESPSATTLRGLYSLLGDGGARFPALVLDSEPDHS